MLCAECELVAKQAPLQRGTFVLHPRIGRGAVPGWWVICPARHVEQYDDLSREEQAHLGQLIGELSAALRASTPTAKIYVSIFAEVLPHLHVHVVARPPELPEAERGPAVFASERSPDPAIVAAISARVTALLSSSAQKPGG